MALFAYAEACLADHRYDESIKALKKILEFSPGETATRLPPTGKGLCSKKSSRLGGRGRTESIVSRGSTVVSVSCFLLQEILAIYVAPSPSRDKVVVKAGKLMLVPKIGTTKLKL